MSERGGGGGGGGEREGGREGGGRQGEREREGEVRILTPGIIIIKNDTCGHRNLVI